MIYELLRLFEIMNKRFKALDRALRYVKNTAGTSSPNVPSGTPLALYYEYYKDERKVTYTRRDESKPKELIDVAVRPFAFAPVDDEVYIVDVSKRVKDETRVGALIVAANIPTAVPDTAKVVKGFIPAKCTVTFPDASQDRTSVESKITGISYDRKGKESYTFPYGSNASGEREGEVRAEIRLALGADSKAALRFKSEKV